MSTRRVVRVAVLAVLACLPSLASASSSFQPRTAARDLDLEPGWPVQVREGNGGGYRLGSAIHTLVGNVDADPTLEIMATGIPSGPLYIWNADGSTSEGWNVGNGEGVAYPSLGQLSQTAPGLEIFSGYISGVLSAYTGPGNALPGWPRDSSNYITSPAVLADVTGDGLDEIFIGEEDWELHAYRADGTILQGWPSSDRQGGQRRDTPAVGDLNSDGDLEIVSVSPDNIVHAYHHTGANVAGFPFTVQGTVVTHAYPVIGNVDGDAAPEIILLLRGNALDDPGAIAVLAADGRMKRTIPLSGAFQYGTAPALADLDGDAVPEIVVQTGGTLEAWKGDGARLPGWPAVWNSLEFDRAGNSSPVIGDVDGDQQPDIVIVHQTGLIDNVDYGEVRVYDRKGNLHPRFPKYLPIERGAVPAIADIDLDGRNEIIVTGHYSERTTQTTSEFHDKVWVYDLGGPRHGKIEWGQFGGGPQHQGRYPVPTLRLAYPLFLPVTEQ